LLSLLENLKSHPPFNILNKQEFREISTNIDIAYHQLGSTIIEAKSIPKSLYFIIKGSVEAREDEELIDIYHIDDSFGGIEIIEARECDYQYSVTEELICYEIPSTIVLNLCKTNQKFREYFFSNIIDRMDMLKSKKLHGDVADIMVAKLDITILHQAILVDPNTPIVEALSQMEESNAVAIVVNNANGYGIVTDADFRHYILRQREEELLYISQIQSHPIVSIKDDILMFNILLLMMEHSIKHLPVFDDSGSLLGVLELVDLLSLFSNQSHLITVQMQKADSISSVISAGKRVSMMVGALHFKGVKSRYIAKLVAEVKKKMYVKIFSLIVPKEWHKKSALILLGSEGREEQILRTDQDNAIVFEDGFMPLDRDEVTQRFIEVLDEIGFPRCEGNIMIINPKWCKEQSKYKKDIYSWVNTPTQEGFMDMAILFDSIAVAGNKELHSKIKSYLFHEVSKNSYIIRHFAKAIENFESPLGLFSRFVSKDGHQGEIDIKKRAVFTLVHGVRALALEHKIAETNTTLRIKALNNIGYMNKEDARDTIEALEVISNLRLHAQLQKIELDKPIDNYIKISSLSKLEKDLLKEALKSIEKFKKQIIYHFKLSTIG